jgi:hypothetical protein
MFIEVTVAVFIAAYISVAALGHVLLIAAIIKCLRANRPGRSQETASRRPTMSEVVILMPAPPAKRRLG